jgi:hypothetical protein
MVFSSSKSDYSDFVLAFILKIYVQLRRDKWPRADSTNDIGVVTQKTQRK